MSIDSSTRLDDSGTEQAIAMAVAGPEVTEGNHETEFPVSPRELSRENEEWLDRVDHSLDAVVEVERLRRTYKERYFQLLSSMADRVDRAILTTTVTYNTTTYNEVQQYTDSSKRTVKNHVWDLRDANILHVGNGRPAAITFVNGNIQLLAEDVLSYLP